ncbi:hypothetical protein BH10CHL1_BH10CHL1_45570 [soil metagenome]
MELTYITDGCYLSTGYSAAMRGRLYLRRRRRIAMITLVEPLLSTPDIPPTFLALAGNICLVSLLRP